MIQESFFPDLCSDHRRLGDLVMTIRCEHDAVELKHLAAELQTLVGHHFEIEDRELYPTLLTAVDDWEDRERLLGAYECNLLILRLLDQLSKTPPTDELYKGKVFILDKLWDYHVHEEEEPIFDMARRYLEQQELTDLAHRIRSAAKDREERAPWTYPPATAHPSRRSFFGSLSKERKRLRELVTTMAAEKDPGNLNYLAYDMELLLRRHLDVEIVVVYPVLEKRIEDSVDRGKIIAAREQLESVMKVLNEVAEMPVTDEIFYDKIRALDRLWSQYATQVEPLLYETARHHLRRDELVALEERAVKERDERERQLLAER